MFLKPAYSKEAILSDKNLSREAYIDTSKIVRQLLLAITGFGFFCLISLGSPDIYLIGGSAFISVPFVGKMSFSLFIILGPIILLSFRIYLHLYEPHYRALHFFLNEGSVNMPPNLTIFNNIILKIFYSLVVYLLVPLVIFFFFNKARAISLFIYPSAIVTIIVIITHIILLVSRTYRRYDIFKKQIDFFAIFCFLIACTILTLLNVDVLRRPLNLYRVDLSNQWLVGSDLKFANLESANFMGANLSGSNLSNSNLKYVNFENAKLENINFTKSDLTKAKFINSTLFGSNLSNTKIYSTTFKNSNLLKTTFNKASINKAIFNSNVHYDEKVVVKATNDGCSIYEGGVWSKGRKLW